LSQYQKIFFPIKVPSALEEPIFRHTKLPFDRRCASKFLEYHQDLQLEFVFGRALRRKLTFPRRSAQQTPIAAVSRESLHNALNALFETNEFAPPIWMLFHNDIVWGRSFTEIDWETCSEMLLRGIAIVMRDTGAEILREVFFIRIGHFNYPFCQPGDDPACIGAGFSNYSRC
jgi:hypothetical protein